MDVRKLLGGHWYNTSQPKTSVAGLMREISDSNQGVIHNFRIGGSVVVKARKRRKGVRTYFLLYEFHL
jgi:hypothetical protein